ncbi:protein kinase domain-containing protein [Nonomuraea dietziae]|uniref:protein kinase domain-containing protein n=1 Tax=Nonomuraea dietziae TaxID=65515 RepID=UPI0033E32D35
MPVPLKMGDPKRLGDYELSGRLGEGGQGVVYLGTLGEESFAVKLLHGPVGDEQAAFLREVELAKHVARFCTAQVVDAGFDDGRPYIVSEYVDGPSLSREVALAGPRSGGALERLAVGTATALAAIHRAGIVHRDFKPQNVLLGPDGPRVIDFGLAKALDAAATVSGRGVGTPAYMAPEQITASAITGAVDVFSWGATMCFAANASAPFGQDSVAPVLHRILTADPELGRLDGRLGALVEHCLDKDPRNRPTSRELLLALLGAGDEVPAEVLRSPPPHILRVDPYPLAEPEATGAAEGYLLPESRGRVPSGASRARASRSARGSGSPAVRSDPRGSVVPWPRVPGDDGGHPSWPGGDGRTPEATHPGRWAGPAANRASLAVSGALLVSAAVLVAVLVPALQSSQAPPMSVAEPTRVTSSAAASPPDQQGSGKIKDTPTSIKRQPSPPPSVVPVTYSVPSLVGMDRSAAVRAIKDAGLVVGSVSERDSARSPGEVLGSTPGGGTRVARGTRVDLEVAAGPRVPALAGLTREAASSALAAAGLRTGKITQSCSELPSGQVISSKPGAGARLAPGRTVSLLVAQQGARVPPVVGLSRAEARGSLKAAGFAVRQKAQIVDDPDVVNSVLGQSVSPGTCATPGRTVVITVGVAGQSFPDPSEPTLPPDSAEPPAGAEPTPRPTPTDEESPPEN